MNGIYQTLNFVSRIDLCESLISKVLSTHNMTSSLLAVSYDYSVLFEHIRSSVSYACSKYIVYILGLFRKNPPALKGL